MVSGATVRGAPQGRFGVGREKGGLGSVSNVMRVYHVLFVTFPEVKGFRAQVTAIHIGQVRVDKSHVVFESRLVRVHL